MPLPKDVRFVSFDCYGTLIDWESGAYDAYQKEADRDGFTIDRNVLIPLFIGHPARDPERLVRAVRRGAAPHGRALGQGDGLGPRAVALELPAQQRARLAGLPRDQRPARALRQEVRDRDPVEHRRQAARRDSAPLPRGLRPRGHRPAGAQLQARPGALQGVPAPDRGQEGLGAHRERLLHRRRALREGEDPGDLGQPPRRDARGRTRRSRTRRSRRSATPPSCSAWRRGWREGCRGPPGRDRRHEPDLADQRHGAARRRRGGADRLAVLPGRARGAAEPAAARRASSRTRCSPPTRTTTTCWAASRSRTWRWAWGTRRWSASVPSPGAVQRELREEDARNYVVRGPRRWRSAACSRCPCPATSSWGSRRLELHPADGHTSDGTASCSQVRRAARVRATTSRRWRSRGSQPAGRWTTTAPRSRGSLPWWRAVDTVVPGHGPTHTREVALRILDEDADYLDALERGEERPALPRERDTPRQREIHVENLTRLG